MSRPEPHERPSARELAGGKPVQIAGKPADVCPYCGCSMFANGTKKHDSVTFRYVVCRNSSCRRSFKVKQPPATIMYEVEHELDEPSNIGHNNISIYHEAG